MNVVYISWHLSYSWGKTLDKSSTKKLTRPGNEPAPAGWLATTLQHCHSCGLINSSFGVLYKIIIGKFTMKSISISKRAISKVAFLSKKQKIWSCTAEREREREREFEFHGGCLGVCIMQAYLYSGAASVSTPQKTKEATDRVKSTRTGSVPCGTQDRSFNYLYPPPRCQTFKSHP